MLRVAARCSRRWSATYVFATSPPGCDFRLPVVSLLRLGRSVLNRKLLSSVLHEDDTRGTTKIPSVKLGSAGPRAAAQVLPTSVFPVFFGV